MYVIEILIATIGGVIGGLWMADRVIAREIRRDPIGHLHRLYAQVLAGKTIIFAPWPGKAFPRAEPPFPPCKCGGSKFPCVGCGGDHCPSCEVGKEHKS